MFCIVLIVAISAAAADGQSRSPIPSVEQQKEIAKVLDDTYGLSRLEAVSKKQDAAKKLMEASRDPSVSADERYVILMAVLPLAKDAGNFSVWSDAVDDLTSKFEMDATREKARLLTGFLSAAKTVLVLKPAVEEALALAREVAQENRFADSMSLIGSVDTAVQRISGTNGLKPMIVETREMVAAREKLWKGYQAANAKLTTDADDANALLTVGRWRVFQESDWKSALPLLAKVSDAKWKTAATLEQASPTDAMAQASVGDAWWELAQLETGSNKKVLLLHAAEWYERAQPQLTAALKKQLVAKRLDEISLMKSAGTTKPNSPPTAVPKSSNSSAATEPGEWVDLLDWTAGVNWTTRGFEWNKYLEKEPAADEIVLKTGEYGRFPLAGSISGSYELELEFVRQSGSETVGLIFPVGDHLLYLELSALNGSTGGVGYIDGKWFDQNGTAHTPCPIANNERHQIRIRAKSDGHRASFNVDLDKERDYIAWEGADESLVCKDNGPWSVSMIRHVWLTSHLGRVSFQKARLRMTSGAIRRDFPSEADREDDLKSGFVRLVYQKISDGRALGERLPINQVLTSTPEYQWPRVTRDFKACDDYYGAHALSRLKCPVPAGAKSFSVVGYNCASGSSKYSLWIDGKRIDESQSGNIAIMKIDVPPKSSVLELVADPNGDGSFDLTYWCYPRWHLVPAARITDKMLDGKAGAAQFSVASSTVAEGSLTHNVPLSKTTVINFRDAQCCDEFIQAHAPSSMTFAVPTGMNRFTAVGMTPYHHQVRFEVWADAKRIYQSPQGGLVNIDVKLPPGTKTIDLKVDELADTQFDQSMWCYPRLYRK
ncbi:MAG: hypothetical protein JWP89_1279 [Schlesneria sp.]|nr:hypothetical protein [Schlesneria sp.]